MAAVQIEEDVVMDSSAPTTSVSTGPTLGAVKRTVSRLLTGRDLAALSLKTLRKEVEERLGVPEGTLTERKEEVKNAAQAFIAAQNAPPAAVVAPLAAAGRVHAQDVGVEGDTKRPAEEEPASAPKKKKTKLSGNRMFSKAIWPTITKELTDQNEGTKPGMGAIISVVSARWKAMSPEEQKPYEVQADEANAAAEANGDFVTSKPVTSKPGGPAKSKSAAKKPKTSDGGPAVTRAEFLKLAAAFNAKVSSIGTENIPAAEMVEASLMPRAFASGTMGWFFSKQMPVTIGDRVVNCQAQLSFMVKGSKTWEDGEGYVPARSPSTSDPAIADGAEVVDADGGQNADDAIAGFDTSLSASAPQGPEDGIAPAAALPDTSTAQEQGACDSAAAEKPTPEGAEDASEKPKKRVLRIVALDGAEAASEKPTPPQVAVEGAEAAAEKPTPPQVAVEGTEAAAEKPAPALEAAGAATRASDASPEGHSTSVEPSPTAVVSTEAAPAAIPILAEAVAAPPAAMQTEEASAAPAAAPTDVPAEPTAAAPAEAASAPSEKQDTSEGEPTEVQVGEVD